MAATARSVTRDGAHHQISLGPGRHTLLHRSDGSLMLLDATTAPMDGWAATLHGRAR